MEIAPCESCGAYPELVEPDADGEHLWMYQCSECGAPGPIAHDEISAMKAWNEDNGVYDW